MEILTLSDVRRGAPGEGVVALAVAHGDACGVDGHADAVRLVVDGDGAEERAQLALVNPLGADQPAVHHQAFS